MSYIPPYGNYRTDTGSFERTKSANWLRDVYIAGVYSSTQNLGAKFSDYRLNCYSGFDLSDFSARKKRNEILPFTPYLSIRMPVFQATGSQVHTGPGGFTYVTRQSPPVTGEPFLPLNNTLGFPFIFSPINHMESYITSLGLQPEAQIQLAASKAYSKGFDALTFVAEFGQLVRLFRLAAQRFVGFLSNLPPGIRLIYGVPVNEWLELRYGWRTLLYDIEGVESAISRLRDIERTASKASSQYAKTAVRDHSRVYNFASADATYSFIENVELGVRGSIFTDFVPPAFQFNLPATIWEKLTLSFVADWFFTVGAAINAISLAVLSDSYSSAYGLYYNSVSNGVRNDAWKPGYGGTAIQTVRQEFSVKRRVPMPIPFRPYSLIRLNEFKVLDLLALIIQRLSR